MTDEAASPTRVVLTIVALTVVATIAVFVWTQGQQPPAPAGQAVDVVAKVYDVDNDGTASWIGLTLTSGPGPFTAEVVKTRTTTANDTSPDRCETPRLDGELCRRPFDGSDTWQVAERLWIPCQAQGPHALKVTIHGQTVLNTTIRCQGPP